MKAFVWNNIRGGLTSMWHDGGAVIAIAETEEEAKKIVLATADSPEKVTFEETPEVWELASIPAETCYIFPDAGCC